MSVTSRAGQSLLVQEMLVLDDCAALNHNSPWCLNICQSRSAVKGNLLLMRKCCLVSRKYADGAAAIVYKRTAALCFVTTKPWL